MNNVVQVTDQTFRDTINFNEFVILDYQAAWCGPCKGFAPVYERVAKDYIGKIIFGKIDVDEFSLLGEHGIKSIPAIVFLKRGVVVDKLIGSQTEQKFRETIAKYVS